MHMIYPGDHVLLVTMKWHCPGPGADQGWTLVCYHPLLLVKYWITAEASRWKYVKYSSCHMRRLLQKASSGHGEMNWLVDMIDLSMNWSNIAGTRSYSHWHGTHGVRNLICRNIEDHLIFLDLYFVHSLIPEWCVAVWFSQSKSRFHQNYLISADIKVSIMFVHLIQTTLLHYYFIISDIIILW